MKKYLGLLLVLSLVLSVLAGCTGKTTASTSTGSPAVSKGEIPKPAADVAAQEVEFYDGAVNYSDLESKLGPIPKPTKPLKLGFVCKAFENGFWQSVKQGAEAAQKELNAAGIQVTIDVRAAQGESDEQGQLAILNDMVNKGYDGIIMSPISEGCLLPGVEKALDKGIPMVVNNDAFMPEIDATAGVSAWQGGLMAAEYMNKAMNGKGKIAIIQGNLKTPPARYRTDAFNKWFKENNPAMQIVETQQADWDRMKARDIAETFLKKYPDLDAIYCNNDTMAMGAVEAAKSAGRKIIIQGMDGTEEGYEAIRKGDLTSTLECFGPYMARISTEILLRKIGGQTVPKVVFTPEMVLDINNIDADKAALSGWKGFYFN